MDMGTWRPRMCGGVLLFSPPSGWTRFTQSSLSRWKLSVGLWGFGARGRGDATLARSWAAAPGARRGGGQAACACYFSI